MIISLLEEVEKLNGTDVHINSEKITYRDKDGKLIFLKNLTKSEFNDYIYDVENIFSINKELSISQDNKKIIINGRDRYVGVSLINNMKGISCVIRMILNN